MIDRALKPISISSQQKEYYNNPIQIGKIFKKVVWGKCPPIRACEAILTYADPATSNKDNSKSSHKGVGVIGLFKGKYYLYKIWLDNMLQSVFVGYLFDANEYISTKGIDTHRNWIENNSLQDPFYEQVIKPLIQTTGRERNKRIAMSLDRRKKGEKYDRVEATLEPIWRDGDLIFNIDEEKNPHMERMVEQFLGVDPNSKLMDGPDLLEGGVWLIKNRTERTEATYSVGHRSSRKY